MTRVESFGALPDGRTVKRCTIAGGGLEAHILDWGGVVQDLRIEGHPAPLVLGFEQLAPYLTDSPHFGAIAGRYANRIRDGHFMIDGTAHQADRNFLGRHLLHGGATGLGKRLWRLEECGPAHVSLAITDPAGAGGFPGTLEVRCTYRLRADAILSIDLEAATDAPTLCNLAQHSYFNLDDGGAGDVLGHRLQIAALAYTPVDAELIPTGAVLPVAETAFDFRELRTLGSNGSGDYDHNFCLAAERRPIARAARLEAARSGLALDVWTTEPGLQVYSGAGLSVAPPGLGGRRYRPHAGIALEPQVWPDAPHWPHFPQALLRPGTPYRQLTELRFQRTGPR